MRDVLVWDPLLRILHWSIALLFLVNFWLLEPGETAHRWSGYAIAALLATRLVWGFIGHHNARFATFLPTPSRLRRHWQQLHARDFDPVEGHNPLGALMVFFLWAMLAITAASGWMQGLDQFWGEDWVEDLHEYAANTLMIAIGVHVIAVLIMSRITGLALVRSMISGRRNRSLRP